jgi:adenylate kinase
LDTATEIELVVNLKLREDVLIMKCLGRRVCSGCGTNYNVAEIDVPTEDGGRIFMPPLLPPPACASKMTIRADDTEEVVRARMNVYAQEVSFWRKCIASFVGLFCLHRLHFPWMYCCTK